jgi:hypothetical protein
MERRLRSAAGFCAFAIIVFLIAAPLQAAPGALDGKTFAAESGEKGKGPDTKDTLIFHDGKMRSTACDAYGFGDGTYTTMNHGTGTMFQAKTESAKEGTIEWNGMVTGDSIDGTFIWTKPGQKPITYWLKGNLKK